MNKVTQAIESTKTVIITGLDDLEETLLTLATRLAPWIAPLGPAIMVYRALVHRLEVWPTAAGAMAAAVELVGIASAHLSIRAWQWNQTRRKSDPKAPVWLAVMMTGIYLAAAMALSVVLEIMPGFAVWSPVVLLLLALVAYVSLALGSQLTRWESGRRDELNSRRDKRELNETIKQLNAERDELNSKVEQLNSQLERLRAERLNVDRSEAVQRDVLNEVNAARLNDKDQALNALLNYYRSNPMATFSEAGSAIERSKGTVSNYLNELEQKGLIHRNGHGVEVLV